MFYNLPIYCPDCTKLLKDCTCGVNLFKDGDTIRLEYLDIVRMSYNDDMDWSKVKIKAYKIPHNPNVAPLTLQEYFDQFKDEE